MVVVARGGKNQPTTHRGSLVVVGGGRGGGWPPTTHNGSLVGDGGRPG